jgi:pseudouridine-5'-phosphate glycosidase
MKMLIFENMSRVARGGIGGVHLAGDEKIDRKDDSTKETSFKIT